MSRKLLILPAVLAALFLASGHVLVIKASPGDKEYLGSLDSELAPDTEELDQVIFHQLSDLSRVRFATPPEATGHITAGRLYNPMHDKSDILAVLLEQQDGEIVLYADVNGDGVISNDEKFVLAPDEDDRYTLSTTLMLPFKSALFKTYPIFIRSFRHVVWSEISPEDRVVEQS